MAASASALCDLNAAVFSDHGVDPGTREQGENVVGWPRRRVARSTNSSVSEIGGSASEVGPPSDGVAGCGTPRARLRGAGRPQPAPDPREERGRGLAQAQAPVPGPERVPLQPPRRRPTSLNASGSAAAASAGASSKASACSSWRVLGASAGAGSAAAGAGSAAAAGAGAADSDAESSPLRAAKTTTTTTPAIAAAGARTLKARRSVKRVRAGAGSSSWRPSEPSVRSSTPTGQLEPRCAAQGIAAGPGKRRSERHSSQAEMCCSARACSAPERLSARILEQLDVVEVDVFPSTGWTLARRRRFQATGPARPGRERSSISPYPQRCRWSRGDLAVGHARDVGHQHGGSVGLVERVQGVLEGRAELASCGSRREDRRAPARRRAALRPPPRALRTLVVDRV